MFFDYFENFAEVHAIFDLCACMFVFNFFFIDFVLVCIFWGGGGFFIISPVDILVS